MKQIINLILTLTLILMASCKAKSQSETATFHYETAISIHYTENSIELDHVIGCDSVLVKVTINPIEVKLEINDRIKIFTNVGNLEGDINVIKLEDIGGGHALLYKKVIDGFQVWYLQGPEMLIRLSNSKPECAK